MWIKNVYMHCEVLLNIDHLNMKMLPLGVDS